MFFCEPSGLAADKQWLYVADSEGSSLRAVPSMLTNVSAPLSAPPISPPGGCSYSATMDGSGKAVHCSIRSALRLVDGTLFVANTYNNKIKAVNLAKKTMRTVAGSGQPGHDDEPASFDEPAGIAAAGNKLYIADTNNHLIRTIDLAESDRVATFEIRGLTPPKPAAETGAANPSREVRVDPVSLKPEDGLVWLKGVLKLPAGYKINPIAPMRYKLSASPETGVVDTWSALAP